MSLEYVLVAVLLVGFGAFLYMKKKKADANRDSSNGSGGLPKEPGNNQRK